MSKPAIRLARSHSDGEHHNTLIIKRLLIQLLYEDLSPMADAEFEAVFGDNRVQGRTDAQGNAIIIVPARQEETFRLFLRSFPEEYVESEGEGQAQKGSKWFWPFGFLLLFLAFAFLGTMVFAGCRVGSTKPQTVRAEAETHDDLPAVSVTLTGPLYTAGGTSTVKLSIRVDAARPGGTVQYGDREPFTLLVPTLKVLWSSESGPVRNARYRLRYALNLCEHAKPVKQGTPITRWDPCYYVEGNPRPTHLEESEVFLNRQWTPDGEFFVAAGISDFHNLSIFRLIGSTKQ